MEYKGGLWLVPEEYIAYTLKGTFRAEATSNSEKNQTRSLSRYQVNA